MNGNITEAFWDIHIKGLTVKGAHMFNCPVNEQRGVAFDVSWIFETAFDLIKNKKIEVSKLISHVIKPEQAEEAYIGLENNKTEFTCVVIDWRD
jgi:threonine dehydrogenase-like Zn-dependent dehydrogenase